MIARNWTWIAGTLLIAVIVHLASVLLLPRLIMTRTMAAMMRTAAPNTIFYPPRPSAKARGVVRPSPDLLYSICVYDLSAAGGALRISTHDMPSTYWSISIFDAETNNFYALNDRQAKTNAADFLLSAKAASPDDSRLPVIVSPTDRGIILLRTLVDNETRLPDIEAARHNANCAPYKTG
jgi:uncharacterized membrane protein